MTVSERLRMLDEAMTPGPWHSIGPPWNEQQPWINAGSADPHQGQFIADLASPGSESADRPTMYDDADGIAALRNALPALIALVEAAEKVPILEFQPFATAETNTELRRRADAFRDALSALSTALPDVEVEA